MASGEELDVAAYVLTHLPVVVSNIFTFVPARLLNKCSRVCKLWHSIALNVKKNRIACNSILWFTEDCLGNTIDGDDVISLKIKETVQNAWSEPQHLFMVCSTPLYEEPLKIPSRHGTRYPRASKFDKMDLGDYMKAVLPKKCKLYAVSADGIIGTSKDLKHTVEKESAKAISFLSLPKIEGLDIYSFTLDIYTYANFDFDEQSIPKLDVKSVSTIPEGASVKAILFFCDEAFCPPEIGYTLLQYYNCVVAGGYVDNLISPDDCVHSAPGVSIPSLNCIALCGDNLKVASIVLKEDVKTKEEVCAAMQKLKNCNFPEEKSFAFIFACVGRGYGHYQEETVESSIFHKFFPNTPVIGFFGNGEVGFNHLPKYDGTTNTTADFLYGSSEGHSKPQPKLYHAYTTIICLVSVT